MSRIRTKVDNRFVVKLLALFSAIALWFFVMNEQNPVGESSFSVPIVVVDALEDTQVTLEEETAKLTLRAPRSLFSSLDKEDLKVILSAAGLEEGENVVRLHASIPKGFELVGISPDSINVKLEPVVEKQFEVTLIRAGGVAPDMVVSATRPKQRIIKVVGPQSQVAKIGKIIGYVGLTADHKSDFVLNVPLSAVSADGHPIDGVVLTPKMIQVEVQLVKGLTKKTVDVKPLMEGSLRPQLALGTVRVTPAKLEIAGSSEVMSNVNFLYTDKIYLEDLTKSEKRTVKLSLPDNVTAAVDQVTVDIEINKK